jgi:hypothetical protein
MSAPEKAEKAYPEQVVMERLETVRWHRTTVFPAGETVAQLQHAAAWVRSMGHEAADVSADGFRYRSIYSTGGTSHWHWIEPGQWLVHMEGERQDREFDSPYDEPSAVSDDPQVDGYYGYRPWPSEEWHIVAAPTPGMTFPPGKPYHPGGPTGVERHPINDEIADIRSSLPPGRPDGEAP